MNVRDNFNPYIPKEVKLSLKKTLAKVTSFGSSDFITAELYSPSTHLLNNKGKLLRPALVFLSAQAMGERCSDYIDLAAAIELLHVSSLVHDDIIDNGKMRRGVKTVNKTYGNEAALLAGNALISKTIQLSARYGKDVMHEVSSTALKMCAGELMDYKSQKGDTLSIEKYIKIAELKTASLIGTSCDIVATHIGSKSRPMLYRYGLNIGMAFQIRDDVIDFSKANNGSVSDKYGANIVASFMRKYNINSAKAMKKAAAMNHHYIELAQKSLNKNNESELLVSYARMIKIDVYS